MDQAVFFLLAGSVLVLAAGELLTALGMPLGRALVWVGRIGTIAGIMYLIILLVRSY